MPELLWLHFTRPRPAWYQLDDAERVRKLDDWERLRADAVAAGATHVGTFHVRGQSDYERTEVWLFPDTDSAYQHWQQRLSSGYADFHDSANSLGPRESARD